MKTKSLHILAEFQGCNTQKLDDLTFIESTMLEAAKRANATVINCNFHKFGPQGVSGVLVLAESHLSLHTWPEHGYAASDIFVCGNECFPALAQEYLAQAFEASTTELMTLQRGVGSFNTPGISLLSHQHDSDIKLRNRTNASAERLPGQNKSFPSTK